MRCNTKQSIHYSASSFCMFWVSTTPIIRRTQNCQAGHVGGRQLHKKIWSVPEAVVTVLCTTDDRCGWHPKHVQRTCRIINRMFCVASRWTIINIQIYTLSKTRNTMMFVLTTFLFDIYSTRIQDCSFALVAVLLDTWTWNQGLIPVRDRILSFPWSLDRLWSHSASNPLDTRSLSPVITRPEGESGNCPCAVIF